MKTSLTPIASAVVLALAGTAVHAQTAPAKPAAAASAAETERVEVIGIRASLQKSLQSKRDAESRVEVITAEDIGKMPDKNVADSLQRVPGLSISSASANEGGFDENDRVSMRGTSPSLTQTLVNGHAISSGDWFVLNQTGTVGRSVSYSLLPSTLVKEVVVHKSPEARLVEGGVAGAINIVTRKPLEFKKPLTMDAQIGGVYADLPGKTDPQFHALLNWKNDDSSFGVMLQAFAEHRHLRRDGQEVLFYSQIKPGSAVATANPDLAGVWYPGLIGSALFEQKREREGGLLGMQFKLNNDVTLGATAFTSQMKAANYNRNYMLWGSRVLDEGRGQGPQAGYVVRNNTLVSASFAPVAGTTYGVYDEISRPDAGSDSSFFTVDGQWNVSDKLKLSGLAGTTKGTGKTPTQDVAEWNVGVGSGAAWRLNGVDTAADWSLGNTNHKQPGAASLGWIFGDQNIYVKDKENFAQLDGEYALDSGLFTTLKFGARSTSHSRSSSGVVGQAPGCKAADGSNRPWDWSQAYWCPVGTQSPADPANFPVGTQNYPGNFGAGLGGNFPRDVWFHTPEQLTAYNKLANRATDGSRDNWTSQYGLSEKTQAAYVQSDMEGAGWSGNVGLRLVQTKFAVTNNVAVSANTPGAITTSAFGPYLPTTTNHSYTDVLPSMNVKFKLNKEMVARLALSRTMTRPDYSALAGSVSLAPPAVAGGVGSGSGGNPDLKPVRSNNLDLTLEYYYAPRSLVSAGLFHMGLSSYVGYGQVNKQFMTYSAAVPQGELVNYLLTVPVNTTGRVNGIELAWEAPLWGNFGANANYTYTDAKEAGGGPLVGASKHTYNLGAYYEDDKFNARVAYNFRSSFYSGLDRNTAFSQDDTSNLAASLGYKINDRFTISLDGHNLGNTKLKYYALSKDQPRSMYENGRQYYLTLRAKL
ncbi:TonB-dependent receptor [Ideonella sp.]|jgi:iron complex outermembrane receptor protein|uniref:TonB-dependent receptor n=1 Tax=Ideonella sp. TaxID=1929293 RepID=UPI0037C0FFA9